MARVRLENWLTPERLSRIPVPRVSPVDAVNRRFGEMFRAIMAEATERGGRVSFAPSGSEPGARLATASYHAIASQEPPLEGAASLQRWLRRWVQALNIDYRGNDEQLHRHAAANAPSVRARNRSAEELLRTSTDEQAPEMFDALVYGQELLHAPSEPSPGPSVAVLPSAGGYNGRFVPPEEPTYEGRLRLYAAKGGTRALAARYTAEILRLPSETLNPATPAPEKERIDKPAKKTPAPAPPLAA